MRARAGLRAARRRPRGRATRPPSTGAGTSQLSQCHDLSPRRRMPAGCRDRGHGSHLRRMQSLTDPADRTDTLGVEAFDATYGARLPGGGRLAPRRRVRAGRGRRGVRGAPAHRCGSPTPHHLRRRHPPHRGAGDPHWRRQRCEHGHGGELGGGGGYSSMGTNRPASTT